MQWSFDNDRPIYSQIIEQMKLFIVSGQLLPGSKVASVRELAAQAGVNPNTMQKALAELERTGLVYTSRTSGRFITENETMILSAKQELAKENIRIFLENMKRIGYDKGKILDLIQNFETGEDHHE